MLINFSDTATAFRNKSKFELRKSYLLFSSLAFPWIVKSGKYLSEFAFKTHLPVKGLIKATVFNQFCGGEDIRDCSNSIDELIEMGVGSILDYSVEGKETEKDFDRTKNTVIETIKYASEKTGVPLAVFKPTGMGRFALLEKVSAGHALSANEQLEWDRVVGRFHDIAQAAKDYNIPVMVDAEESWIQQAVDDVVTALMMEFNTERVLILNTIQFYRHDRLEFLQKSLEHAVENNYFLGVKIVRGAYMEKERNRAEEMGYLDPIQPDKAASDRDYDAGIRLLIDNIDRINFVCGTHNEASSQLLVSLMAERGIDPGDRRIWFAQLYGMSDHISFNLAASGFNVVKYLPFGPVRDVMPYLIRRAEENTSVRGQTGRELGLIKAELRRRKQEKHQPATIPQ
ncbi:proline dehydrogenase family protein [Phaeocystidibacter luteus]|uniref:Proline dehydrogenase n=1 Tax=Phaeocystidibacter luteus TaxID=911197 RepID=A0A6N6RL36_9FLAO|nr:proline dehydrogenase family protein [Phaeocystidibacter luteus]KAB2810292.1 proline dehydrogenase [Phaeocystidibacter luteus]